LVRVQSRLPRLNSGNIRVANRRRMARRISLASLDL